MLRPGRELVYRDIAVKRDDLASLVRAVRTSLDQSGNAEAGSGRLVPFDVVGAHELYRLLLVPVAAELAGVSHLIVVPDEVLLPLPFGILVTKTDGDAYRTLAELASRGDTPSDADLGDYTKLAWLAREYAITVLPSATSLRALRQIPWARAANIEPFIGFGDPVLGGRGARRGGSMVVARGANARPRIPVRHFRKKRSGDGLHADRSARWWETE